MNRLSRHLSGVLFIVLGAILAAAAQDQLRLHLRLLNLVATATDPSRRYSAAVPTQHPHTAVGLVPPPPTVRARPGRYGGNLKKEHFIFKEDGFPHQPPPFTKNQTPPVPLGIFREPGGRMDQKTRPATQAVE